MAGSDEWVGAAEDSGECPSNVGYTVRRDVGRRGPEFTQPVPGYAYRRSGCTIQTFGSQ